MATKSSSSKNVKIVLNSPVILGFTFLCVLVLILSWISGGKTNTLFFSVYKSSLANPLTYIRFFGHVLGHAGFEHLIGNIMLILVIGPILEEKYGSKCIVMVMLMTAFVTGLVHFVLSIFFDSFANTALLGASGIVFAFILLASISGFREREIPMTFILVAILYLGQQIYEGFFVSDNVSQLTHIVGGLTGAAIGYRLNKK